MALPRFMIGQKVRVVQIDDSDTITSRDLIGLEGVVEEIDSLVNGQHNYSVVTPKGSSHYLNEYMLEVA